MSDKANRPPSGQQWVWLTRELLSSDAWRSLTTNSRRFVDFLLLEHMRRGGKDNGRLKAPYRQLVAFGISSRLLPTHIREAEELGLVDCYRGGMRVATGYAISWLPLHDGAPATNRWKGYRNPDLPPLRQPKSRNLPAKVSADLPAKVSADDANLPAKVSADDPGNLPAKVSALYRSSYQGGADNSDLSAATGGPAGCAAPAPADGAASAPAPAVNGAVATAKQPWHAPVVIELPLNGQAPRRPVSPQEPPPAVSALPRPDKTQVSSHE